MTEKLEHFVASLTDQEIDSQLKDIFEWAKIYKELLEAERAKRRGSLGFKNIGSLSGLRKIGNDYSEPDDCDESDEYDDPAEFTDNETYIDYLLAQSIQQKVSTYSAEKTQSEIDRLKQLLPYAPTQELFVKTQYELETCELHLFDLTGQIPGESNICVSCGAALEANARFCGKCGTSVKGS